MTDLNVEQKIAAFLETHQITIVPEGRGDAEALGFVQHLPNGEMRYLGEIIYDTNTGSTYGADADNMRRRLQLPGFITEVTRPMVRLLKQASGDFYTNALFDPIHTACDKVDSQYR